MEVYYLIFCMILFSILTYIFASSGQCCLRLAKSSILYKVRIHSFVLLSLNFLGLELQKLKNEQKLLLSLNFKFKFKDTPKIYRFVIMIYSLRFRHVIVVVVHLT